MKLSLFFYFSITILALTCAGCGVTLQSKQYSFVKALFEPRQEVPEKNWQVTWRKRVYPVYAINHESGTYFANEQAKHLTSRVYAVAKTYVAVAGLQSRDRRNAPSPRCRDVMWP